MVQAKVLIDEDVHDRLAGLLRESGIDAVNVREIKLKGTSDHEILSRAVKEGRAIFSFNLVDYEKFAVDMFKKGMHHYGIIVSPQRGLAETLERLSKLLSSRTAEDLKDQLIYL